MPLRILCAPEVDSCHAQDRVGQDRAEQEKSRARQYWAGQVQARLGQNRASLDRAGLGWGKVNRAQQGLTIQGWAAQG